MKAKKKKDYQQKHRKKYFQEYYQRNKDKKRQYHREWYQKNKERLRKWYREYNERNNRASYYKKWREKNRERLNNWYREYYKDSENRRKKDVRLKTNNYVRYNNIRPEKCVKCGSDKNIEKHHLDYNQPLKFIWVCKKCHRKIHRKEMDA